MENILSKRLKAIRKAKGIDQAEAATALGLNRSTYTNYELGRNQPSLEALNAILAYFGVSYEYLSGIDNTIVHLNKIDKTGENRQNVPLNVLPNVLPSEENGDFVADPGIEYGLQKGDARNAFKMAAEKLVNAQRAYNSALFALIVQNGTSKGNEGG